VAARQVLQTIADQDFATHPQLVGIGEIHVFFC
jgi:hypothetical protein